jgi:hypothetical protein
MTMGTHLEILFPEFRNLKPGEGAEVMDGKRTENPHQTDGEFWDFVGRYDATQSNGAEFHIMHVLPRGESNYSYQADKDGEPLDA